jgi:hypothetical protein
MTMKAPRVVMAKALVHGHVKKDGTVVRQYERKDKNSRSAKFGRVFAAAIRAHDSLSHDAQYMLSGWNINWHTSDFARWDNGTEKSAQLRHEVKEAFKPVRDVLRREFGDTVRLYRGQKEIDDDQVVDGRQLFSWSPDAGIASEYAHGRALPPEITDKQIAEQLESYRRSGVAKLGRSKFVRTPIPDGYEPDGPDYYYIYEGREMITDGDDLEEHFRTEQADRQEWIDELKSRGRVHAVDIPVDDVVWIPVGPNLAQPELITTHNPLRPMVKSIIAAHTRRLKSGKVVNVRAYSDKRTRHEKPAEGQASLFSDGAPAAVVRQTETRAFKEWFGESKVTRDGEPLRMYHASYRDFDTFDRRASVEWRRMETMDTVGSWFSDSAAREGGAGMYADGEGAAIYPVYLSIQNPKFYATFDEFLNDMHRAAGRDPAAQNPKGRGTTDELRAKLKAEGYDGIRFGKTYNKQVWQRAEQLQQRLKEAKDAEWSAPKADRARFTARREKVEDELRQIRRRLDASTSTEFDNQEVWIAFEPEQIKSAIGNSGAFSKDSPVITKSAQADRRRILFMKAKHRGDDRTR